MVCLGGPDLLIAAGIVEVQSDFYLPHGFLRPLRGDLEAGYDNILVFGFPHFASRAINNLGIGFPRLRIPPFTGCCAHIIKFFFSCAASDGFP